MPAMNPFMLEKLGTIHLGTRANIAAPASLVPARAVPIAALLVAAADRDLVAAAVTTVRIAVPAVATAVPARANRPMTGARTAGSALLDRSLSGRDVAMLVVSCALGDLFRLG